MTRARASVPAVAFDEADLAAYTEAVSHLAGHAADRLFGAEGATGPDGNLAAVADLMDDAAAMGMVRGGTSYVAAAPDGDTGPDEDFTVWGRHVYTHGCDLSLLTLSLLAETCAGLAAAVHARGIGSLALGGSVAADDPGVGGPSAGNAAAVFAPAFGLCVDPRTYPDAIRMVGSSGRTHLHGRSPFVWADGQPDHLAVFARYGSTGSDTDVVCVALRNDAPGLLLAPVGPRVGLRAARVYDVSLDLVEIPPDTTVATGAEAARLLTLVVACDWLGLAAIGLGTARAALREARTYASTRHQGGGPIGRHATVRLLLAEASHHITTLDRLLDGVLHQPLAATDETQLLRLAATVRLGVGEHAAAAVTNCIQVLGGYGYMDDYGLSKRLRDVGALRTRHGNREQLLLLIEELEGHGSNAAKVG